MGLLEQNLILIAVGAFAGLAAAMPLRRAKAVARARTRDLAHEMASVIEAGLAGELRRDPLRPMRPTADRVARRA